MLIFAKQIKQFRNYSVLIISIIYPKAIVIFKYIHSCAATLARAVLNRFVKDIHLKRQAYNH